MLFLLAFFSNRQDRRRPAHSCLEPVVQHAKQGIGLLQIGQVLGVLAAQRARLGTEDSGVQPLAQGILQLAIRTEGVLRPPSHGALQVLQRELRVACQCQWFSLSFERVKSYMRV